jgi:hypothetical protein
MSEPMSAGEIEDVLSSIRRLVSEELRPLNRSVRGDLQPESTVKPDTKLLLTPALRVVPDPEPAPAEIADAAPEYEEFDDSAPMAWSHEPDEEGDVTRIDGFVFQGRARVQPTEDILDPRPEDGSASEAVIYHGVVLDPDEGLEARTEAWAQDGPAEELDLGSAEMPDDRAEAVDLAWMDQAEAEVMAALSGVQDEPSAKNAAPEADRETLGMGGEPRFDAAVLRDLVRDLIREELQGSLGERITRNVRKLVRVEVARALSLHDFE